MIKGRNVSVYVEISWKWADQAHNKGKSREWHVKCWTSEGNRLSSRVEQALLANDAQGDYLTWEIKDHKRFVCSAGMS